MNKSEKYIQKQKEKYAAKINESQSFKDVYIAAAKKGDLDIYGKLLETQMPDTYQQMKDDIGTIKERLQTIMTLLTKE